MAVGMAMNGMRPVVEMQFDAFAYPAFEQIVSHVAKMRNRTRGAVTLPMVIRVPYAGGIGGVEHHCDSSEAYYAHTPGLKVVTPATVADAYGLLREAIDSDDPVMFMEPKKLYWSKDRRSSLPRQRARRSARAAVRREGRDATLIAYGPSRAGRARGRRGRRRRGLGRSRWSTCARSCRSTTRPSCASVRRTGRAVVVAEAQGFASVAAEIVARVRNAASTPGRAGPPRHRASTSPIRRRSSSTSTCPAWTGSSTPSTDLQWERTCARREAA